MNKLPDSLVSLLKKLRFEMTPMQVAKAELLYTLAQKVPEYPRNTVVDLGTYHGFSSFVMASTHCNVTTIDDYVNRYWKNEDEESADDDYMRFFSNKMTSQIPVTFIRESAETAALNWAGEINLLFWDLGIDTDLESTLLPWVKYIAEDGYLVICDTFEGEIGAAKFIEKYLSDYNSTKIGNLYVVSADALSL